MNKLYNIHAVHAVVHRCKLIRKLSKVYIRVEPLGVWQKLLEIRT